MAWLYAIGEHKKTAKDQKSKPPPPEEELLHIFYTLLDSESLDAAAKSELVALDSQQKWMWVQEVKSEKGKKAIKFDSKLAKEQEAAAQSTIQSIVELAKMAPADAEEEGIDRVREVRLRAQRRTGAGSHA